MVVEEIVPAAPTTIGEALVPTLDEKSEVVDTSKPEGGVTLIPAFISAPETLKDWATDGEPATAVNASKEPEVVITGTIASPIAKSPKPVNPLAEVFNALAVPAVVEDQAEEAYLLIIKLDVVAPASISPLTKLNVGVKEVNPAMALSFVSVQKRFTLLVVISPDVESCGWSVAVVLTMMLPVLPAKAKSNCIVTGA